MAEDSSVDGSSKAPFRRGKASGAERRYLIGPVSMHIPLINLQTPLTFCTPHGGRLESHKVHKLSLDWLSLWLIHSQLSIKLRPVLTTCAKLLDAFKCHRRKN